VASWESSGGADSVGEDTGPGVVGDGRPVGDPDVVGVTVVAGAAGAPLGAVAAGGAVGAESVVSAHMDIVRLCAPVWQALTHAYRH
jgi:hypothetical protein